MEREKVITAIGRVIIKSSRNIASGRTQDLMGLARLVSAYNRLLKSNAAAAKYDPLDGDPEYFESLFQGCSNKNQSSRRLPI
jgi:hypothetical protein